MNKLYMLLFLLVVLLLAYGVGVRMGREQCQAQVAAKTSTMQYDILKSQGEINAVVLRTSTGDIRRVLREKYTIAE